MKFDVIIAVKERKQLPQGPGGLDQNPPDDFTIPFHLQKSPQSRQKESKYLLTTTFQW